MNRESIDNLNFDDHHEVALLCGYLSTVVYENRETQYKWIEERFKLDGFVSDSWETLQYFSLYDHKRKILFMVVRGTDINKFVSQWEDLAISLNCLPKFENGYRIHRGYRKAGENLYKDARTTIEVAHKYGYRIIFTGHSLGGVLSKYLAVRANVPCDVYTFGAPMLASEEFYKDCKIRTLNKYVSKGDIIPDFPSLIYSDSFPIFYELDGTNCIEKEQKNLGVFVSVLNATKVLFFYKIFTALKAHSMKKYTIRLAKFLKKRNK